MSDAFNKQIKKVTNSSVQDQVALMETYQHGALNNPVASNVFDRLITIWARSDNNQLQTALVENHAEHMNANQQYDFFYHSSPQLKTKFIETLGAGITLETQKHLAHFGTPEVQKALVKTLGDDLSNDVRVYLPTALFNKQAAQEKTPEFQPEIKELGPHQSIYVEQEAQRDENGYDNPAFILA